VFTVLKDNSPAVQSEAYIPGSLPRIGMRMWTRDFGQAGGAPQLTRKAASSKEGKIGQTGRIPKSRSIQPQIQFEKHFRHQENAEDPAAVSVHS
jgi:hypothetical protein